MSSLVDLSRLFPHLCPGLFRPAASREPAPTPALEQAAPVATATATGQDATISMRAKQLMKLHQRTLRNQRHGNTLTHSGLLTA